MKVVIVSSSDLYGGAARASYRLHKALINHNINSTMVVQKKISDDYTVIGPKSRLGAVIDGLRPALDHIIMKLLQSKTLFSSSYLPFSPIASKINALKPDIVHLHWITGGTLRIEDLQRIKAPIVLSCHDMWPFTGGCHYDENCGRYIDNCGSCKVLKSNKENDISRRVFNRKLKIYSKIENLLIICSSRWLTQCAQRSTLFKHKNIVTLPNCIDTELFQPIDKNIVKNIFSIPKKRKIILFSAMNALSDPRKGFKELYKAINMLQLENIAFVISGSSKPKDFVELNHATYFIPPLADEYSLPLMYNIADVVIVPSLQENLANSIIESLSCGVPVVAFNVGGNPDIIEHKKNGYLAQSFESEDMAYGIEWVLNNKNYASLSNEARYTALNKFDSKVVAQQYIKLYENFLKID
ncbi:glycosyltransferase family 4 protein [Sulfurimonas sp.]